MTTRVHITVDTEFNIGGAFEDPENRQPVGPPAVYCEREGRSEGLGYLLDTLEQHGIRGTFFVEALNTCYFGDEPMGRIAREIHARGHEVQLHLHPCWTYFEQPDWKEQLTRNPPNDDMTRRDHDELVRLIELGQQAFRRWALPEPRVLRTGGLRVGLGVYRAMRECGMPMASNVGLAIFRPEEPELHLFSGDHEIDGVREFPVTSYIDWRLPGKQHHKTLTVTGCSWPEIRSLLRRAQANRIPDVVLLTHPFEFVKHDSDPSKPPRIDRINRHRLEKLCAYIAAEPGLEPGCIGDSPESATGDHRNMALEVPLQQTLARMLVNRFNQASIGV
ncbi:polysaccharide deacetylase family protein [Thioalkalivibrio sp. ALJ24]|uniref:polysaccharide deacetylase family protein n=1 Tax=Thioalkalivibrio sp. ALJ24 TaxID=545276 RepID=UPI00035DD39F|nr:polysaccharide deacetylase family protein [Thioalkalivibrio sp. ALJ24]